MSAILEVTGLSKRFARNVAVERVDLRLEPGVFYGLVGPNGAGKTTTIRMCVGMLRPDGGTVLVDGVDLWRDPVEAKARIGVLPDTLNLYERLSGTEYLDFAGHMHRLPRAELHRRRDELLAVLGLDADAHRLVAGFSQGMKKKLALAAAVIHSPRVLFLDEPFESVDPISARTMREVLRRVIAGGSCVVMTSHVMALVERMVARVGVIDRGRLVADGSLDDLCREHGVADLDDLFLKLVGTPPLSGTDLAWLGASSG
jgi:ABC-2 type transport system ATP-binding protein